MSVYNVDTFNEDEFSKIKIFIFIKYKYNFYKFIESN